MKKGKSKKHKAKKTSSNSDYSAASLSTSSRLSTRDILQIVDQLQMHQHRDSTRKNYYTVWKLFNEFFIRLDVKPSAWEHRLTLFVGYLINSNKKSTVRSYISAIKAVLKMNKIKIQEDQYLLTSLTRACKLKNDTVKNRLPISKSMLSVLLRTAKNHFDVMGQPFLSTLYSTILLTMYLGMFRVSEVTSGAHPVLDRDVHIGKNKKKFLFVL